MRIQYLLLSLFVSLLSCEATSQNDLKELGKYILKIDEPSGLTTDGEFLYIVSDRNGKVYKTNFKGKVLGKFDTNHKDLEGITFNKATKEIALISESKRKLYVFDPKGTNISEHKIKGKQEHKNSGLEGIAYNSKNNSYYVANEKKPKQLLQLDQEFKITAKLKFDFLDDISGVCYDESEDVFWVVSDESRRIYKVSTQGKLLNSFKIKLKKAEGIVCFEDKLAVVSDAVEVLVIFEKPN